MRLLSRLSSLASVTTLAVVLATPVALAERADDTNRKSKNGKVTADVGGVEVTVEYGRPKVRDRAIFGGLVKYDEVWRTGADEATVISVSGDVVIGGETVPAGRYALFSIPSAEKWTFIVNENADQWGSYEYSSSQDLVRVDAEPMQGSPTEEMTFTIEDGKVMLHWADVVVGFPIEPAS